MDVQGGQWRRPDPGPHQAGSHGSLLGKLVGRSRLLCGLNVPLQGPRETEPGPSISAGQRSPLQPGWEKQDGECVYFGTSQPQKSHTEHFTSNLQDPWQPTASWLPPSALGLVAVCGRDQNKGVEEECRAQREIPEPPSFCLLPPTVPLWATRCAALESTMNKSQQGPALSELSGQREGVQSLPPGGHRAHSNKLNESKGQATAGD